MVDRSGGCPWRWSPLPFLNHQAQTAVSMWPAWHVQFGVGVGPTSSPATLWRLLVHKCFAHLLLWYVCQCVSAFVGCQTALPWSSEGVWKACCQQTKRLPFDVVWHCFLALTGEYLLSSTGLCHLHIYIYIYAEFLQHWWKVIAVAQAHSLVILHSPQVPGLTACSLEYWLLPCKYDVNYLIAMLSKFLKLPQERVVVKSVKSFLQIQEECCCDLLAITSRLDVLHNPLHCCRCAVYLPKTTFSEKYCS